MIEGLEFRILPFFFPSLFPPFLLYFTSLNTRKIKSGSREKHYKIQILLKKRDIERLMKCTHLQTSLIVPEYSQSNLNMEKSKTKLFHKIFKPLSNEKVLIISFVAVLLVGLLWIFYPFIDGASEIFYPGSTYIGIELLLLVTLVATVVVLFHIACFSLAVFYNRSAKYLVCMLIPLGLLAVINHILYPAGLTRTDRRIDSFQLGARYRLVWAGGASKVRQEALALLAATSEVNPAKSKWPNSIRALCASSVKVDKKAQLVDVEIPRLRFFVWGDQFGYLITKANAGKPVIVDEPPIVYGHRLWKIADGIYLYEKW